MKRRAIYPGSFDPFTRGHHSIVQRTLSFMDELVIAIGVNPGKKACFAPETRQAMIAELYAADPRIKVVCYSGLTSELGKQLDARFIIRGVRSTSDFEYEQQMAATNQRISGIETILLFSDPKLSYISSSMVRELMHYGSDVSQFLPRGLQIEKWIKHNPNI